LVVSAAEVRPKTDNTLDLGTTLLEFKDAFFDGTVKTDNLTVDENATVTGNLTVNGNTTIGNAATDTVTVTADVASDLIPSADDTYDLGASGSEWKDLYIDGTANIDSLVATSVTSTSATVGGSAVTTEDNTQTLTNKTIDSANNTLTVDLSEATVTGTTAEFNTALSDDNFATLAGTETLTNKTLTSPDINGGTVDGATLGGNSQVTITDADMNGGTIDNTVIGGSTPAAGSFTTLSATGNVTLGNAATDTVTITADVASNVIPSADNTYDLGAPGSEWKNLYIDGTANIDSLVANTADINGGTIDNTVIGGSTPAAGSFTTITGSGDMNIDSGTLFVDASADAVGIGTSSPTQKLDVRGNIAATDLTKDARINADGSLELTRDDGVAYIDFRSAIAEDFDCRIQQASDGLAFQTGGNGSTAERMRIDSSGNLLFNSGYGSVATAYGCRAWVQFNGTGTVAIRDSGNVSSITDQGTGEYVVNFGTAMPDSNYCIAGCAGKVPGGGTESNSGHIQPPESASGNATSSQTILTLNLAGTFVDRDFVHVAIFR